MAVDKNTLTLDARPDRLDLRDRQYRPPLKNLPSTYPADEAAYELFKQYTDRCDLILDQGEEGACTGFGLAAVINYLNWKDVFISSVDVGQSDTEADIAEYCIPRVSERMLYHNARLYDEWDGEDYEGSSCRGAMKGWHRHGVCSSALWPYRDKNNAVRFVEPDAEWVDNAVETPLGSYYRIDNESIVDMQAAIYEVGAIYCSCRTHSGWFDPKKTDKTDKTEKSNYSYLPSITEAFGHEMAGGHAFAIVGYTRDGLIVQNSWGTDWGFGGFAILGYDDWVHRGSDAWVAVRGAPTNRKRSPTTVVHQALQDSTVKNSDREGLKLQSISSGFLYTNDEVRPWSEEQAYQHTIVVGNNGRAIQKLIDTGSPEDCIRKVGFDFPDQWRDGATTLKIAVYVHGGLNSEKASIRRVQILGPYFLANGIYPIFITWKTGVAETLKNIVLDSWTGIVSDPRSGSLLQEIRDALKDKVDRTLEVSAKKLGGKSLWTEMKENAALGSDSSIPGLSGTSEKTKGAMVNLIGHLQKHAGLEIHLVGHSAGSIILGKWLDVLSRRSIPVTSLTLYAPACSVRFANRHFANAIKAGVLAKSSVSIDILSDERERADSVGPYGKSLLYLVSRAFEDMHKEPLLGLEATWTRDNGTHVYRDQNKINLTDEELARFMEIDRWLDFWDDGPAVNVHDKGDSSVRTSIEDDFIELSHGSFDNNISVVEATLTRILNKKPSFRVENLGGF